jgi:energy-coupling factor transport system ATP-binding protein
MLVFDKVTYRYNANADENVTSFQLKEVSFTLRKNVIYGIIGGNGSGKSTVARLATGLLQPASGTISIEKKEQSGPILQAGVIFQNPDNQIVGTTVEEDLAFGLENLCIEPLEMRARIAEIAEKFALTRLLGCPVSHLSGGQKQMLCIAGVMVMRPTWVFFDEPTSHLDPWARRAFWDYIHSYAKNSDTGIAIISQLPGDLEHFDQVLRFNSGQLDYLGKPEQSHLNQRLNSFLKE